MLVFQNPNWTLVTHCKCDSCLTIYCVVEYFQGAQGFCHLISIIAKLIMKILNPQSKRIRGMHDLITVFPRIIAALEISLHIQANKHHSRNLAT